MRSEGSIAQIGRGVCVSVIFTLAAVLLFALAVRVFSLSSSVISPVNRAVKFAAIFFGCFFCVRPGKAFFKGVFCGLAVTAVTYVLFSLLAGGFSFGWMHLLDLLFGGAAGGISALIAAAKNKG